MEVFAPAVPRLVMCRGWGFLVSAERLAGRKRETKGVLMLVEIKKDRQ
jgi:hypothetical protein